MYTPTFKKTRKGVPILSKEELDDIGEQLVGDYYSKALQKPMELDVDRLITRYLGMEQDFQFLSCHGKYLGMTVFNDTNRVIVFNAEKQQAEYLSVKAGTVIIDNSLLVEKQEHRYRFTAAHEAAHGILHTGYYAYNPDQMSLFGSDYEPMVQCRSNYTKTPNKPFEKWSDTERMEWQANRLASAMLMPKSMVLKVAHDAENSSPRPNVALEAVVDVFNVSNEAAFYRLKDLGFVPGKDRACLPF